jgi:hypothetical protein
MLAVGTLSGSALGAATAPARSLGVVLPWSSSYFTQLDAYSQEVGLAPALVGTYRDWTIPLINTGQLDGVISRGATPQVTWEPWDPTQGTNQPLYALSTITNGSHDAYIQASGAGCCRLWQTLPDSLRPGDERLLGPPGKGRSTATRLRPTWRHGSTSSRSSARPVPRT